MVRSNALIPPEFEPIPQSGSFIGHVGGLHWRWHEDRVETCVVLDANHVNPNGTAHGGALLTLLDITLGATVQASIEHVGDGHPATISLTSNFIGAVREGELLMGEARVDASTRTLSFASGRLHVNGRTVLTGSAVFRNPPPAKTS